jgi:hypothetical protein
MFTSPQSAIETKEKLKYNAKFKLFKITQKIYGIVMARKKQYI